MRKVFEENTQKRSAFRFAEFKNRITIFVQEIK